jgi:hypothetical protein
VNERDLDQTISIPSGFLQPPIHRNRLTVTLPSA